MPTSHSARKTEIQWNKKKRQIPDTKARPKARPLLRSLAASALRKVEIYAPPPSPASEPANEPARSKWEVAVGNFVTTFKFARGAAAPRGPRRQSDKFNI